MAGAELPELGGLVDKSLLLRLLPRPVSEALAHRLQRREVAAGSVVVREGDEADSYYLIASGEMEVWVSHLGLRADIPPPGSSWMPSPSRHSLVARLGRGDGFGELALLLGSDRRATVRASAPGIVYALDAGAFRETLDRFRGLEVGLEAEVRLRLAAVSAAHASVFSKLPPEGLRWLALRLTPVDYRAGEEVVHEGDIGDAMFIVDSGELEVVTGRDGGANRIATLGPGDLFGEQALVTHEVRVASVRSVTAVRLLRLSKADFEDVLTQYAQVSRLFVRLVLQRQRPLRVENVIVDRLPTDDVSTSYVLKDTVRFRYFKLSEQGAFLWSLMDGTHTVRDISVAFYQRFGQLGFSAVLKCMVDLHAAGFVQIQNPAPKQVDRSARRSRFSSVLTAVSNLITVHYFSIPDPDKFLTRADRALFKHVFSAPAQVLLLAITLGGAAVYIYDLVAGRLTLPHSAGVAVVAIVIATVLHMFLHELAHAVTCKRFGREVHRAGVGWYLFFPVAFVDTTDMWLSSKWPRIAVSWAGPYTNFWISGVATLLALVVRNQDLQAIAFTVAGYGYIVGLLNLNPLIELDGYYVLMDWLAIPNLRAKALSYIGHRLRGQRPSVADARTERIYFAFGALAATYVLFVCWTVFVTYQRYIISLVPNRIPLTISTALGWFIAGSLALLVLMRVKGELFPEQGAEAAAVSAT